METGGMWSKNMERTIARKGDNEEKEERESAKTRT
jgi:hypothetical protein